MLTRNQTAYRFGKFRFLYENDKENLDVYVEGEDGKFKLFMSVFGVTFKDTDDFFGYCDGIVEGRIPLHD